VNFSNSNKIAHDEIDNEALSENLMLEEELELMGALSAAATIRRNYPHDYTLFKRYGQHYDKDREQRNSDGAYYDSKYILSKITSRL